MIAYPSEEPLRKITLNLFARDVEDMKRIHGYGYTEEIRRLVRRYLKEWRERHD